MRFAMACLRKDESSQGQTTQIAHHGRGFDALRTQGDETNPKVGRGFFPAANVQAHRFSPQVTTSKSGGRQSAERTCGRESLAVNLLCCMSARPTHVDRSFWERVLARARLGGNLVLPDNSNEHR